jgi:hypothetical protein
MRAAKFVVAASAVACATAPEPRPAAATTPAVEIVAPTPSAEAEPDGGVAPALSEDLGLGCPAVCRGSLGPEAAEAIRREVTKVRRCYDRQLKTDPEIQGRMLVELLVLEDGAVCSLRAIENEIDSPALLSCVLAFFQSIRIEPENGCVTLRVPLLFRTADAGP